MKSVASSPQVTINPRELLRFFDEKPAWSIGHATSVVGIAGEDLNAACFQHYLEARCAKVRVLDTPVTTGQTRGPRLDRWIDVAWSSGSRTVFQTEIKNWSAHAVGGKVLPVSASPEEVAVYKQARWERRWDEERQTLNWHPTAKVLVRMKPPEGIDERSIRPLLILWEAIGPRDKAEDHLFSVNVTCDFNFPLPSTWPTPNERPNLWDFQELWVFSVSSYLRSIPEASVELYMPNVAHRLGVLERMFRKLRDSASDLAEPVEVDA